MISDSDWVNDGLFESFGAVSGMTYFDDAFQVRAVYILELVRGMDPTILWGMSTWILLPTGAWTLNHADE